MQNDSDTLSHGELHPHIVPVAVYLKIYFALAALLVVTVLAAEVNLGYLNTPIAMTIALGKAALIVLVFMNIRYAAPLVRVFSLGAFLWLFIMFGLTFSDLLTRY